MSRGFIWVFALQGILNYSIRQEISLNLQNWIRMISHRCWVRGVFVVWFNLSWLFGQKVACLKIMLTKDLLNWMHPYGKLFFKTKIVFCFCFGFCWLAIHVSNYGYYLLCKYSNKLQICPNVQCKQTTSLKYFQGCWRILNYTNFWNYRYFLWFAQHLKWSTLVYLKFNH